VVKVHAQRALGGLETGLEGGHFFDVAGVQVAALQHGGDQGRAKGKT
jgi:hypothetical protein